MGRNKKGDVSQAQYDGRPLREGVGRNFCRPETCGELICRPLREGVGRNLSHLAIGDQIAGRPLREGVGRNRLGQRKSWSKQKVALYARAWVEIARFVRRGIVFNCRPLREGVGRNP